MAIAKRITKKVPRPVVYDEVDRIELELTVEEAVFLQSLMSLIGGDPVKSMRKYAEGISRTLDLVVGERTFTNDAWRVKAVSMYFANDVDIHSGTTTEVATF